MTCNIAPKPAAEDRAALESYAWQSMDTHANADGVLTGQERAGDTLRQRTITRGSAEMPPTSCGRAATFRACFPKMRSLITLLNDV